MTTMTVMYIPRYNNEAVKLVPSLLEITSLPNNSQCNLELINYTNHFSPF